MSSKSNLLAVNVFLLLALLCFGAAAQAAQTGSPSGQAVWQLTRATVADQGKRVETAQGILIQGYVLEAQAGAPAPARQPARANGLSAAGFRVELTIFSPSKDMPGQKAGRWYLRGQWTLLPAGRAPEARQRRHTAYPALQGILLGECDSDPTSGAVPLTAQLKLPPKQSAGKWVRGMGTFSGDSLMNGTVALTLVGFGDSVARAK